MPHFVTVRADGRIVSAPRVAGEPTLRPRLYILPEDREVITDVLAPILGAASAARLVRGLEAAGAWRVEIAPASA